MQAVHYSTTTVNGTSPMTTLPPLSSSHFNSPRATTQSDFEIPASPVSDKYTDLTQDTSTFTTQYYTTIHPAPERLSTMHAGSPLNRGDQDDASSKSNSSSSDSESSGGEGEGEREAGECIVSLGAEQAGGAIMGGEGTIKNWTYEDQFKQLYNMTPEPERREFLDKLFSYMQNKGTPITRIPIMAKQPLDLYKLFKLVVQRGGLVEVIKKKAWRNVAKELNLPASITSAAFTMRSQYVKYLYPYECEVAQLSSPHELQLAIESNKRDRRHSDTVDFLSPQMTRPDLEQAISPVTPRHSGGSNPQGLQLITSPTVAIPNGAMPPYSGGFIVTGSGGHQVVQMTHQIPGIPIVVPGTSMAAGHTQPSVMWAGKIPNNAGEEAEGDRGDPPPAKKMALDMNSGMIARLPHGMGNLFVTPNGSVVQQHPSSPQFIQMAPGHPQLPIVIPAPVPARANGKEMLAHKHSSSPKSVESHSNETPDSSVTLQSVYQSVRASQSNASTAHHSSLVTPHVDARTASESETGQRPVEVGERSPGTATKMPFANISIQSAGGKTEGVAGEGRGESLLVTMEINNVVFQGVLFAKPQQASSSPK